jgi:HemY protein
LARRVQALRLKLQASRQTGDTAEVLRITHLLEKHHDMSAAAANAIGEQAARELLNHARHDAERLGLAFTKLEPRWRSRPAVAIEAAKLFAAVRATPRAREALLDALASAANANVDASALLHQALARHTEGVDTAFLARVEQWRKAEPRNESLALLAGCACAELELWGKARQFLGEAAESSDARLAHVALVRLAKLEEHLGEASKAAGLFRAAALKG